MIQIYLLTGFLGAGKTTMLQSLLTAYEGKKIGVIVNDFGKVNVDARLVEREGIQMAQLSNGSIFCACIKDKFVDGLIEMSGQDVEYLFIEASGLADPSSISQILSDIRPYTVDQYELKGSICILDGKNFLDMLDIFPALENQVAYASWVILNKGDLIDLEQEILIRQAVEDINPGVPVEVASHCQVNLHQMLEKGKAMLRGPGISTNTYESRPASFVLQADEPLNLSQLEAFFKEIAPDCFRMKGFACTDEGPVEISAVRGDVSLVAWKMPMDRTEIVVISAVGISMLSRILQASESFLGGRLMVK